MQILIAYASVEGQTRKIARVLSETLTGQGHEVSLVDVADTLGEVDLTGCDAAILAASVHQRRHPDAFEAFVLGARERLTQVPTLMLSVSLKAAFPAGQAEAAEYLEEMQMRTGWTPTRGVLVAGAVQAASYDYFETQVLRHVVLDGEEIDPAKGPQEFTDWAALDADVQAFLAG